MLKYLVALVSALFLSVSVANAGPDVSVFCTMSVPKEGGGVVAPEIIIVHKSGDKTAVVFDGYIKNTHDKPLNARVTGDTSKRLSVKWVLKPASKKAEDFFPNYNYSANYVRSSGRLNVSGYPSGYDNHESAHGTCKPYKG